LLLLNWLLLMNWLLLINWLRLVDNLLLVEDLLLVDWLVCELMADRNSLDFVLWREVGRRESDGWLLVNNDDLGDHRLTSMLEHEGEVFLAESIELVD